MPALLQRDHSQEEGEEEEQEGIEVSPATAPGSQQVKWWHVPDGQIEELVRRLAASRNETPTEKSSWRRGKQPKPLRRSHWGEQGQTGASGLAATSPALPLKSTPQDALDEMLRSKAVKEAEAGSNRTPLEDDGEPTSNAMKLRKPMYISDERLEEIIRQIQEANEKKHFEQTNQLSANHSRMQSTVDASPALSSSLSPCVRSGVHVRLKALGRSEPIPCQRTGRRHAAAPKAEELIAVFLHMMDTGTRFSLNVHPDLRIGPDQPPPANIFTEQFGLGACTKGFDLKAQSFDYRYRRWTKNPRPNWVPSWTDSLKAQVELITGVAVSKQRLMFHGFCLSNDFTTVRTAGLTSGVELQLFIKKTKDLSSVTLASTAKRQKLEEARQALAKTRQKMDGTTNVESGTMKAARGDFSKQTIMPPLKFEETPNLFGRQEESASLPSFGEVPIFRPDIEDKMLQRVRSLPCYTMTASLW